MITHFNEPTMMPTYFVAGASLRQVWASNVAAFDALGIFRDSYDFILELTRALAGSGTEVTTRLEMTLPLLEDA